MGVNFYIGINRYKSSSGSVDSGFIKSWSAGVGGIPQLGVDFFLKNK